MRLDWPHVTLCDSWGSSLATPIASSHTGSCLQSFDKFFLACWSARNIRILLPYRGRVLSGRVNRALIRQMLNVHRVELADRLIFDGINLECNKLDSPQKIL